MLDILWMNPSQTMSSIRLTVTGLFEEIPLACDRLRQLLEEPSFPLAWHLLIISLKRKRQPGQEEDILLELESSG